MSILPRITIDQLRDSKLRFGTCYQDTLIITDQVEAIERFRRPCRINAVTALVCISGEADCMINLHRYHLTKNMLMIAFPDDIIQIESACALEAYAVLMAPVLLNELGLDNGRRSDFYLRIRRNAACHLPQDRMLSLKPYYALLCDHILHQTAETWEIIRGLLHAFAYTVITMMISFQPGNDNRETTENCRDRVLFNDFMTLVKRHHTKHRGVKFYADRLCLTPNYLSGAVKGYTGKTATEWVNDFVILEAKIMLKDTKYSIQEIADRLNFPDQSTFGKYYKKITGMGPKQYRDTV